MDDSRGIRFLLSLAALPIAACGGDDAATGSATTGGSSSSSESDGSVTLTDASITDTDSTVTDASASVDSSSTGPSTVTDPTEGSTTDPSTTTDASTSSGVAESGSSESTSSESTSGELTASTTESTGFESESESASTGFVPLCTPNVEVPDVCVGYEATIDLCYGRGRYNYEYYCACVLYYDAPMYGAGCVTAFEEYYACIAAATCEELMDDGCATEIANLDMECV